MSDFREHPEVYKSLNEDDTDDADDADEVSTEAVETATTKGEQKLKTDKKHKDTNRKESGDSNYFDKRKAGQHVA